MTHAWARSNLAREKTEKQAVPIEEGAHGAHLRHCGARKQSTAPAVIFTSVIVVVIVLSHLFYLVGTRSSYESLRLPFGAQTAKLSDQ